MKRFVTTCFLVIMLVMMFAMVSASSGIVYRHCDRSLEFELDIFYQFTNFQRYDFHTGVSYFWKSRLMDRSQISPDNAYRYDTPRYTINDYDIFSVKRGTGERNLIFGSPFVTSVHWSQDSRSLLIWEFIREDDVTRVTSIDIQTRAINFEREFAPTLDRERISSPDKRYIYARYLSNVMLETYGILFVDTLTGDVSRFDEPVEFPFAWSDDARWVASQFEDRINIIDPQTGDFHPNFNAAIQGENFIWHGDTIWFTRRTGNGSSNVLRAALSDASIDVMIEDARLEALSDDGQWTSIYDERTATMALFDLTTETRYPLYDAELLRTNRDLIRFSSDSQCAAILLSDTRTRNRNALIIFDLEAKRIIHQQAIIGEFNDMSWAIDD